MMFRNYFKTAWRSLWKNKIFSAINVAGLSAGIAFALLIGAYVWSELQINRRLQHADRQYILTSDWKDPNMGYALATMGPLAKRLKEEYPSIVRNYYRFDGITSIVSNGDKHLRESVQLGDSSLLSMYGFTLLQGDARSALNQPYTVVLTETAARKYFGTTDVIGRSLDFQSASNNNHAFTITGVLKEPGENSVTHLSNNNVNTFFISFNNFTYFGRVDPDDWTNKQIASYVELQSNATKQNLAKAIAALLKKNTAASVYENLTVYPVLLKKYYLQKDNAVASRMLYTLACIGLFILLMAIINFVNIAISSSGRRTREIGVRKVMGGLRTQLIAQFLTESLILVFIATAVALAGYPIAGKLFGSLVGKPIQPLNSFPLVFIFIPPALVFLIAFLAGIYPAFVLSSLKAADAIKGKLASVNEKIFLRKSLVGLQFCIALVVLIAASVVTTQVAHFFSKSLGYNKDFIISSQVPRHWSAGGVGDIERVRNEFANMAEISEATVSYEIPDGMNGGPASVYSAGSDAAQALPMQVLVSDEHYLSTYEIALQQGSYFSGHGLDSGKLVINEQAAHALGFKSAAAAIGRQVSLTGDPTIFTIKGVTKDFHFGSMQEKIPPIVFMHVQFGITYRYLSFKIKPERAHAAVEAIQKRWSQLLPGSSFEYKFMDETLAQLYAAEIQLKKAAYVATVLALIIMLLGVLGLISLSIQKRIKEIGIRKILGSSVSGIVLLFTKEFMLVILPAAAVAFPVAGFLMSRWLNNYADRIAISPQPFVVSVLVLSFATLLLISLQTIKAALSNPVKSLRTE